MCQDQSPGLLTPGPDRLLHKLHVCQIQSPCASVTRVHADPLGPTSTRQPGTGPPHRTDTGSAWTPARPWPGCVYKMKRADPEPAPAELPVGARGRHVPGNHSSGQRVLCPTEGQRRARERQGCLPPCRAPAAICALGSHPSARPQRVNGIKSQAPRATSTASALTDSWRGSDQFPWKSTHLLAAKDMCKLWVYPSVSFKPRHVWACRHRLGERA